MIYRLTTKLAKKIYESPVQVLPPTANEFLDWGATCFFGGGSQYVLLTHRSTLLSCVFRGRGVTDFSKFLDSANSAIRDCLLEYGFGFVYEAVIAPNMRKASSSKVGDRSLNGVMVDLVKHSKSMLEVNDLSPHEVTIQLNRIPQCSRKETWPVEAFSKLQGNPRN